MAIVESTQAEKEMLEDLARINRLVEEHRVEEARRLAPELAAKWPESRQIQHMARVLEPPRIVPSPTHLRGRNLDREYGWLRQHAQEYPGSWIAVYRDQLIAADPELRIVVEKTKAALPDDWALIQFQPAEQS